jgi:hypothetical protein
MASTTYLTAPDRAGCGVEVGMTKGPQARAGLPWSASWSCQPTAPHLWMHRLHAAAEHVIQIPGSRDARDLAMLQVPCAQQPDTRSSLL